MFTKVLIANRGEIACRVIRTARRMGIATVAVFSDADSQALHVEMADEAVHIGPPPARESYLRIDRIIEAAQRTGAQAIHPGYGFLSENARFVKACDEAGIVFIGPPASAMRAMGSKAEAKRLMQAASVPLVPGYHGSDQSDALLAGEAAKIGYPVLIKASAGGGGRGMRAVDRAEDFTAQLTAARREAEAAFGDGRVLIEKYLQRPRHIEVQVLADMHGNTVHLGTRDCSIQRRHQKIVEEAPAPDLSEATREKIHAAAVAAARACGYVNAGTIEFIAEGDGADPSFYFMEMNTRLQVEHPVTEAIFGLDLVEWQLRIAAGQPLPPGLATVPHGHAIEVRLCAEDPTQDFRPSTGPLQALHLPHGDAVRVDTGFRTGDRVSPHYDSMLAKIIAHGPDRDVARARLRAALAETALMGPATNLELLRRVVGHPVFAKAALDTGFIARHRAELLPDAAPPPPAVLAAAALDWALHQRDAFLGAARQSGDPGSPWHRCDGFRLAGHGGHPLGFRHGARSYAARVIFQGTDLAVAIGTEAAEPAAVLRGAGHIAFSHGAARHRARVLHAHDDTRGEAELQVTLDGDPHPYALRPIDLYSPAGADAAGPDRIAAPIPGVVVRVDVAEGDAVTRGQVLAVLEAMKTEIRITAPADGTVSGVKVAAGQQVQEGFELVILAHEDAGA
jgi:3-methylcrotonyl-CoA carboxylase alpha subunit